MSQDVSRKSQITMINYKGEGTGKDYERYLKMNGFERKERNVFHENKSDIKL